jgi:hypothetical protein
MLMLLSIFKSIGVHHSNHIFAYFKNHPKLGKNEVENNETSHKMSFFWVIGVFQPLGEC